MPIRPPAGPLARLALGYAATRLAALLLLVFFEAAVMRDPYNWLAGIDQLGLARAFPEYPLPAVALLYLPIGLGVPTLLHYFGAVIGFMLLLDAAFTWMLWRAGGRRITAGLSLWLLLPVALGPILYARFDLVPAIFAAAALLALSARPAAAGAFAALGCGFKLWPAFALPALLAPGTARARAILLAAFAGTGLALAFATAAAAGSARVWSPLTTQLGRGLQAEAVSGLPLLWLRYFDGGARWSLTSNPACHCHEIAGPGVEAALLAGTLAAIAGGVAIAWLHLRAFRAPGAARSAALAALLASVTMLLVILTSRVLSPQYLIWLAALLAAAGALSSDALPRRSLALFAAACVCSQLVYPLGLETLLNVGAPLHGLLLATLTARDALLVVLALYLARQVWRATAPAAGGPA